MRLFLGVLASLPALVSSLASTDSYRDADLPQSGYLPNHNLDPNVAGSSSFRSLWTFTSPNPKELWLAKPLVFTPDGGSELVITASEMNVIRVFDSKTGNILNTRTLQPPFLAADSNCGDIPDFIGVTGTPIIDPATSIMYVFSKGYRDGTSSGTANGVYKMYAIRIPTLEDVSGFPVLIDGKNADNDPSRYFVGGVALQRPSLAELNGHIVAAFGSHCGRWNYTGYLVSVSKTPSVGVVSMWATEASPGAPKPQALELTNENSGKAGIWQSGMGLPVIGNNIYFVVGNGQGHANGNIPASGRIPMSTLDECVVKMELSAAGKLNLIDYFQPYDYIALDAGDRDVGSSGLAVLDPAVFKGTGVNRMCVTAGKKGRVYVMNADNLGGFRQAPDGGDGILQTIELGYSLYGGFGSYPAEGGYIYATTVGGPLVAYKLAFDAKGAPQFVFVGKSDFISAGRVGVGQMTITSDNGKTGSGIVWVTDVNNGLQAFKAVPENGVMVQIKLPQSQGVNKFQRPVFGNGRVFFNSNNNKLAAFGAPVNQAVNCTSPVDFGTLEAGSVKSVAISCKANVALTSVNGCTVADSSFRCDNSTLPAGAVAAGTSFNLNVTWDLSTAASRLIPGSVSAALSLSIGAAADYSSIASVTLQGSIIKQGGFLSATPTDVAFGRLVLRDSPEGLTGSVLLQNVGNGTMKFTGYAWQANTTDATYTNLTSDGSLGSGFSSTGFPAVGSSLESGKSLTVPLRFMQQTSGSYATKVTIWSDGGAVVLTLSAAVNEAPAVVFEVSDGSGNWTPLTDFKVPFGNVLAGGSADKQIRVCNKGGAPLTITISKPPASAQLFALNPNHELTEGTQVVGGSCAIGSVGVRAAPVQPNHPYQALRALWTISTDGLDPATGQASGLHNIVFDGTVATKQVGPLLGNGTARYQWVGCFYDTSNLGRNLANSVNTGAQQATNTLQQCQTICQSRGFSLSGVQYHQECWCGNSIKNPSTYRDESLNLCTFDCTGDTTQACGGDGGHMSLYADISAFDIYGFYRSLNSPSSISSIAAATSSNTGVSSSAGTSASASASTASVSSVSASASSAGASASSSASAATTSAGTSAPGSSVPATSTAVGGSSSSSSSTSSSASPSSTVPMSSLNPKMPATIAGQWQYAGCFKDLTDGKRLLSGAFTASDDMTLDKCAAACTTSAPGGGAFNYFGVEYGRECFCGWSAPLSQVATEADCSFPCAGSSTGLCGAGARLSLYNNTSPTPPPAGPVHAPRAGNYSFLGCQSEGTNGRALQGAFYAADTLTTKICAAFCSQGNWLYMGVEYARECFCGNATLGGSLPAPNGLDDCNMKCAGNSSEYCGAGGRLDLYKFDPLSASSSTVSISTSVSSSATSSTIVSSSAGSTASSTVSTSVSSTASTWSSSSSSGSSTASSPGTISASTSIASSSVSNSTGIDTSVSATLNTSVSATSASPSDSSSSAASSTNSPSSTTALSSTTATASATSTSSTDTIVSTVISSLTTSPSSTVISSSSTAFSTSTSATTSSLSSSVSSSITADTSSSSSTVAPSSSSVTADTVSSGVSSSSTVSSSSSSSSSIDASSSTITSSSASSSSSSSSSSVASSLSSSSSSTSLTAASSSSSSSTITSGSSSSGSSSSSTAASSSSSSSTAASSSSSTLIVASTSSLTSSSSSSSSLSSSSSASPPSPVVPSVPASTTTSTSLSTTLSTLSTTTGAKPTPTDGYYYIGCYQDRSSGHALPLLFANQSGTPELCIRYANSVYSKSPTPTTRLAYLAMEYYHECYGGSSFDYQGSAVTSLVGTKACKNYCYGSVTTLTTSGKVVTTTNTANYCGGAKMFDLYALSSPVAFPTTGGPVVTKTAV